MKIVSVLSDMFLPRQSHKIFVYMGENPDAFTQVFSQFGYVMERRRD